MTAKNFFEIEQLLASEALSQWQSIKARLVVKEEKTFKRAIELFRKVYLEDTAKRDQKRYL